jgi:hypothetical protein
MTQQPLIFATFLAPVLYKTCLYITEHIEQYTGIPTFLLHGESFADFAAGAIDAGFVSGLGYVYLACQQPAPVELIAVPVLQSHGAGGQSSSQVFSDIVVRKKVHSPVLKTCMGAHGPRTEKDIGNSCLGVPLQMAHSSSQCLSENAL